MKLIYIKNYLKVSKLKINKFVEYLYTFDEFSINNQKIILNDNSLILELNINSNSDYAKSVIDEFFEEDKEVDTTFVDELIFEGNELTILNEDKIIRKVAV